MVVVVVVVVVVSAPQNMSNTMEGYSGVNESIFQKPVPCSYVGLRCHRP
jgi:hypothetical protein